MSQRCRGVVPGLAVLSALVFATPSAAQEVSPEVVRERLARIGEGVRASARVVGRLSPAQRARLSSGARNRVVLEARWPLVEAAVAEALRRGRAQRGAGSEESASAAGRAGARRIGPGAQSVTDPLVVPLGPGRVTNRAADAFLANTEGYTQNESATAWCSPNVVVAFNDSGSFLESLLDGTLLGTTGLSSVGISRSGDNGDVYRDLGYLPTSDSGLSILGSPAVACSSASTFHIAVPMTDRTAFPTEVSAIAVLKSTDGGRTWSAPEVAASADAATHVLDKPWIAVDPADPLRVYVAYVDVDTSGAPCAGSRSSIRLARSIDGGATFLAPQELSAVCDLGAGVNVLAGPQVAVGGLADEVLVAFLRFDGAIAPHEAEIRFHRSTDDGVAFPTVEIAATAVVIGFDGVIQGGARQSSFPMLAADRSGGPRNGRVYVTWNDGGRLTPGPGDYRYSDIRVASRPPGGFWSAAAVVNDNVEPLTAAPFTGRGTDQFRPGIAVDRTGTAAICFYDRRRDRSNFLMTRWCARSGDGGLTWTNAARNRVPFAFLSGQDPGLSAEDQGDYDSLASDALELVSGFRGAWSDTSAGSQDLKQNRP